MEVEKEPMEQKELLLLWNRLCTLLARLEADDSQRVSWKAMREYDALYNGIKAIVDDARYGIIYPSSGRPKSDFVFFFQLLFLRSGLDTIETLWHKAMLLENYFRKYVTFEYPHLASQLWEVKPIRLGIQEPIERPGGGGADEEGRSSESVLASYQHQLVEEEDNLLLIQEHLAQYVLETDRPLELVKEERRKQRVVEELRRRIRELEQSEGGQLV